MAVLGVVMVGRVKWFNDSLGYGMVDTPGRPIFIHYTDIRMPGFKTLQAGQEIQFDLYETDKGYVARNVRIDE